MKEDRIVIDGLEWCAECRRAVDRGWAHSDGCSLAPLVQPTEEELRQVWRQVMRDRVAASEERRP